MVQLQEYDLEIRHIKGVQNNLADILSRNPSGMTEERTRDLIRPDQVMVHHIEGYKDKDGITSDILQCDMTYCQSPPQQCTTGGVFPQNMEESKTYTQCEARERNMRGYDKVSTDKLA
jgi:hypothetical protein